MQRYLRIKLEHIDGPGIKVHKGNRCKIKGCDIQKCLVGVEIKSADPRIIMNTIKMCYENGIVATSKMGLRCDGIIEYNDIQKCKENGILC